MKNVILVCYTVFVIIMSSCTSTKIISSWREPNKEVKIGMLNKVLVVAMLKTETNSRKAEDEMVGYLNGKGVVSYNYLGVNFKKQNEDAIREKIKADGFDGAVTMRLIDVDKEQVYQPSSFSTYPLYYQNFSGYFYRNYPFYTTPGYYATTRIYTFETNVYSIKEDKIIWTGVTKTINPAGVVKMTNEIAKVVYDAMVKEGFINEK